MRARFSRKSLFTRKHRYSKRAETAFRLPQLIAGTWSELQECRGSVFHLWHYGSPPPNPAIMTVIGKDGQPLPMNHFE